MRKTDHLELMLDFLIEQQQFTFAICDHEGNIVHTRGLVGQYFVFPTGTMRYNIAEVVIPILRGEVLSLFRAVKKNKTLASGKIRQFNDSYFQTTFAPIKNSQTELFILSIQKVKAPKRTASFGAQFHTDVVHQSDSQLALENELITTREHLQSLVEELATTNEEMQALNEEAQASNEELQATNEELEAANEEMQATNEELISVNEELNAKSTELSKIYEEYAHLYDALEFPILVFDKTLDLMRFNASASRIFSLRLTAQFQHVSRIKYPAEFSELESLLGKCLSHGERQQKLIEYNHQFFNLIVSPGFNQSLEVITLIVSLVDVTELVQAQFNLSESEQRMAALMANTNILFAMRDLNGHYIYSNQRFNQFFEMSAEQILQKSDFQLFNKSIASDIWRASMESLHTETNLEREYTTHIDGEPRYVRFRHQTLLDNNQHPMALVLEGEDITEQKQAETMQRINASIFEHAGEAIVVLDAHGKIYSANRAFSLITGYSQNETLGKPGYDLLSQGDTNKQNQHIQQSLSNHGHWKGEVLNVRKNGEHFPQWLSINKVSSSDHYGEYYVAMFSDISEIKNTQKNAEYLAEHDPLTNLPNRNLFTQKLRKTLSNSNDRSETNALLFIDLDNFKTINDTLGHDVGDNVLQIAASRLRHTLNSEGFIARLGGDEFTVILPNATSEIAANTATSIIKQMSDSFEIAGRHLFISSSIGIALSPRDGNDEHSLLKAADAAMYKAKESGKNCFAFFEPELQLKILRNAAIEHAMRLAVDKNNFNVVYQPKFMISEDLVFTGAEALIRWNDPDFGNISPAEFIPLSEKNGLVHQITKFVVSEITKQLAAWKAAGLHVQPITFNCSAKSLHSQELVPFIVQELERYGLDHQLLQIEITESALLENNQMVTNNLEQLNQHGILIHIDDFGTGYSSLSYVKRLNVSTLKIDQSFVAGLGFDHEDEAITDAVLSLARSLAINTIAEGVETEQQLEWLKSHGCNEIQGYLLAKPLPVEQFIEYLKQ